MEAQKGEVGTRLWAEVATSEDKEGRRGAPGAGGWAAGLCGADSFPFPTGCGLERGLAKVGSSRGQILKDPISGKWVKA